MAIAAGPERADGTRELVPEARDVDRAWSIAWASLRDVTRTRAEYHGRDRARVLEAAMRAYQADEDEWRRTVAAYQAARAAGTVS